MCGRPYVSLQRLIAKLGDVVQSCLSVSHHIFGAISQIYAFHYTQAPLKIQSEQSGIPVHFIPSSKGAFKTWPLPPPFTPSSDVIPLLITASFGRIIPSQILNFFPPSRRLNVHPSMLPLYRGPAPIQHTIADGKTKTGVCVLEMKEKKVGIDCGEIWGLQEVVSLLKLYR